MSQLRFHNNHGSNVILTPDNLTARHLPGYGKGLIFSSHPIRIGEKVSIKLTKLSNRLSSTICFGFTSKNPNNLSDDLQSSYLDLFKSDFWIWPLFKNMCIENAVLFYYVSRSGEVHFGIDGQEIDSFFKKVNTRGPLWAILDIDGESTTVQMVKEAGLEEANEEGGGDYFEGIESGDEFVYEEDQCTVCCQKAINTVLYKCGHMCMCYECAVQQKQGHGNGQCPFCRADIKDIIRIYK